MIFHESYSTPKSFLSNIVQGFSNLFYFSCMGSESEYAVKSANEVTEHETRWSEALHIAEQISYEKTRINNIIITSQNVNSKIMEGYLSGHFLLSFISKNQSKLANLAANDYQLAREITNDTLCAEPHVRPGLKGFIKINSVKSLFEKSLQGREILAVNQKAKAAKCILHLLVTHLNLPDMNKNAPIRHLPPELISGVAETLGVKPVRFSLV